MPVISKPKFKLIVDCPHCTAKIHYEEMYCLHVAYPYEPDETKQKISVSCQNCATPILFDATDLMGNYKINPKFIDGLLLETQIRIRNEEQKHSIRSAIGTREIEQAAYNIADSIMKPHIPLPDGSDEWFGKTGTEAW